MKADWIVVHEKQLYRVVEVLGDKISLWLPDDIWHFSQSDEAKAITLSVDIGEVHLPTPKELGFKKLTYYGQCPECGESGHCWADNHYEKRDEAYEPESYFICDGCGIHFIVLDEHPHYTHGNRDDHSDWYYVMKDPQFADEDDASEDS